MNLLRASFSKLGIIGKLLLLLFLASFSSVLILGIFTLLGGNSADIKWIQSMQCIALFIIPSILYSYLVSENPLSFLQLNKKSNILDIITVFCVFLAATPFFNWTKELNMQLSLPATFQSVENWMQTAEAAATELTKQMLDVNTIEGLLICLIVMALLPAIGEELMFRGAILRALNSKIGLHLSVWISAILFSAIHFQFYGFLPRMLLGAFFAYVVMYSGNIRLGMWLHFFNNAIFVIMYYMSTDKAEDSFFETMGTQTTWWMGALSGIVVVVSIIYLQKYWKTRDAIIQ